MGAFEFSEEARLYAEYFETVGAMRDWFEHDISQFLNLLRQRIQDLAEGGTVQVQTRVGPYWYVWLADDPQREQHPYLWCEPYRPGTVPLKDREGEMVFHASSRTDRDKYRQRRDEIDAVPTEDDSTDRYTAFKFTVKYAAVETLAEKVATVLGSLRKIESERDGGR